jgi:DNA modification methylase
MDDDQERLADELFGTPMAEAGVGPVSGHRVREAITNARPGDLVPAARAQGADAPDDDTTIPDQEEFYRSPVRFGSIPVEQAPLGWDRRQKFNKLYPYVSLPTQVVERVSFGNPLLEPNRLFWGDNLHVMRQLPSESIDLIYIDPPFFSGRQYNVIFGDQNEIRSFGDIWDGGMPGYLEWLNARLFEMKRLLRPTGSIYVHLDWHAAHYAKVELDKLFGHESWRNEISWRRDAAGKGAKRISKQWPRNTDTLFWYSRSANWQFVQGYTKLTREQERVYRYIEEGTARRFKTVQLGDYSATSIARMLGEGLIYISSSGHQYKKYYLDEAQATIDGLWTDIPGFGVRTASAERIGYPTQKPEDLLQRIIDAHSRPGDVVADFFVGGGTTAAVAQRLGRRWIACDQSRVAVAVTADRLARQGEQMPLAESGGGGIRDFTIEHWGTYEAARLSQAPPDQFRRFVIDAAQLRAEREVESRIHAFQGQMPVWIGPPSRDHRVSPQEVVDFANAVRRLDVFRNGTLREARMIAWAFSPTAQQQGAAIAAEKQSSNNYLDIELVRIESEAFREHIARLSSDKADYGTFLTFTRPPEIVVGKQHVSARTWRFDVSDTLVTNTGAKLINVQWDFDYRDRRFTSSLGYKDLRNANGTPKLVAEWTFPAFGQFKIACKVQDDMGGEGFYTETMTVDTP